MFNFATAKKHIVLKSVHVEKVYGLYVVCKNNSCIAEREE